MNIQQMRYFCVTTECGSITEASKHLFVSQPALSMCLKKIEEELGVDLFERNGRYCYLTQYGKDYYHFAKNVIDNYDHMLKNFSIGPFSSQLRICFSKDYIQYYLLPAFIASNPDISVSMQSVDERNIDSTIKNHVSDLVISNYVSDNANIESEFFFRNRLLVSIPKTNPLSKEKKLEIEDLQEQSFIRTSVPGEFTEEVNTVLSKRKIGVIGMQIVNYASIKVLQQTSNSLIFLNSLMTEFDNVPPGRKVIPVSGEEYIHDMYINYHKKNKTVVQPFIDWVHTTWPGIIESSML